MTKKELINIIQTSKYMSKYEAVLNTKTSEVFAYEAISIFENSEQCVLNSEQIFQDIHHYPELFFALEKKNKRAQINNYKKNQKLILNFDADLFSKSSHQQYWYNFLTPIKNKVIVNIFENGRYSEVDFKVIDSFSQWLHKNFFQSSIGNIFKEQSIFSLEILEQQQYIKIDNLIFDKIRKNIAYIHILDGLIKTAKKLKVKTIIGGVQTQADHQLALSMKIDYIQGSYFKEFNFTI